MPSKPRADTLGARPSKCIRRAFCFGRRLPKEWAGCASRLKMFTDLLFQIETQHTSVTY